MIRNMSEYVRLSFEEYGIAAGHLLVWTDEEYDLIAVAPIQGPRSAISAQPPHHRLV
jgi:hypothetical protein